MCADGLFERGFFSLVIAFCLGLFVCQRQFAIAWWFGILGELEIEVEVSMDDCRCGM